MTTSYELVFIGYAVPSPSWRIGPVGRAFPLEADVLIELGRSIDAEISLSSGGVARRHLGLTLKLRDESAVLSVEDLGGANGTELNGARIPPRATATMVPGNVLRIAGLYDFELRERPR